MEKYKIIKDIVKEINSDVLFLEEQFDKALIGTCLSYGGAVSAAYSSDVCIRILMEEDGMGDLEAFQKFHDTIMSSVKHSNRPVFINDFRKIKHSNFEDIDANWTLKDLCDN